MNLLPNMVLSPVDNRSLLIQHPVRVLTPNLISDLVTVIEVAPRESTKKRKFFTAPFKLKVGHIEAELEAKVMRCQDSIRARADVIATDEALNKKYKKFPCYSVKTRDFRFSVIQEMAPTSHDYFLFLDSQSRNEIIEKYLIDKDKANSQLFKRTTQQVIFQFLAEGSKRESVTPYTSGKGARGVERQQRKKLGRKNAVTQAGELNLEGFVMTENDKECCAFAFRNYLIRGVTIQSALDKMWREFYSDLAMGDDGKTKLILKPRNQRPSKRQFKRWGEKYSNQEAWQKRFNPLQLARIDRSILGNQTDEIINVGQLAGIDSTTTDTEFVSVTHRLKRIGQAYRMLLVDGLYGYIPGFYMGIEAPSYETVKLAFLHAASDKTEWIESLGLSDIMTADDWLPIQFGHLNADNTDARNSKTMAELEALGTGVTYLPVARSDLNSLVETKHLSLHRASDHKLSGTTQGKLHTRGDEKADHLARLTIIEGIRETARAIYYFNTVPLVNEEITLEIRRELINKGLTVNRLNLTRLAMSHGKLNSSLNNFEELMCIFGARIEGTFTAKGVKLHRGNSIKREFIDPICFVSKSPEMLKIFHEAKVNRDASPLHFVATFYINPYFPSKIYYPDPYSGAIHELDRETKDEECDEFTLYDYLAAMENDSLYNYQTEEERDQRRAELDIGIENTNQIAETEYQAAKAKSPPIPKSKIAQDKKLNRQIERSIAKHGVPELPAEIHSQANAQITLEVPKLPKSEGRNLINELLLGLTQ